MATRNARTNGKSAGDNGKRPAHSAGPDIPRRGSNLLADPTPGPGLGGPTPWLTLPRDLAGGILGGGGVKNRFFFVFVFLLFLFFPRKKAKKNQKTAKKKLFGRTPPSRRGGPPKFPATFTTFPDGAAKSAKFPPNLAKVHVPRRLVTIRGILFHLQAPKVGWHSQRKRLQVFFCCFFPIVFFVFLLFFFLIVFFFQNG